MDRPSTEAELESFRNQWRSEVSARNRAGRSRKTASASGSSVKPAVTFTPAAERGPRDEPEHLEHEGKTYHDLEDKSDYLKLGNQHVRSLAKPKEPVSALEHYEKAVERESQGNLGDSISHYRRAFKLNAAVQEEYKKKHFPATVPTKSSNSNVPATDASAKPTGQSDDHVPTLAELMDEFSNLSITGIEPDTNLSAPPPCPLSRIPEEVIAEILRSAGLADVATFSRLAQTCKRLAYLVMTEDRAWKPIVLGDQYGIRAMHYRYACNIDGVPLLHSFDKPSLPARIDLTPSVYPNYRSQFRNRPRIRFNGCYISTVNYSRPGGASQSQFTWNSPVHIVTYYRYLRFFREGSCISLLTTSEPADTVHYLTMENVHDRHTGTLPSSVMKDALRGRWRLSGTHKQALKDNEYLSLGPGEYPIEPSEVEETEQEGELHIETDGVKPKYMWKMHFSITSAGRKDGTRNNKLSWKGFWSYNRLTDDWGEFGLKNDRPFYWSRVKSYA